MHRFIKSAGQSDLLLQGSHTDSYQNRSSITDHRSSVFIQLIRLYPSM